MRERGDGITHHCKNKLDPVAFEVGFHHKESHIMASHNQDHLKEARVVSLKRKRA
jgi:hypothetical protein